MQSRAKRNRNTGNQLQISETEDINYIGKSPRHTPTGAIEFIENDVFLGVKAVVL